MVEIVYIHFFAATVDKMMVEWMLARSEFAFCTFVDRCARYQKCYVLLHETKTGNINYNDGMTLINRSLKTKDYRTNELTYRFKSVLQYGIPTIVFVSFVALDTWVVRFVTVKKIYIYGILYNIVSK